MVEAVQFIRTRPGQKTLGLIMTRHLTLRPRF